MHHVPIGMIVTGGQTGVDRAALDVAVSCAVPYSGWCPRGGWAEDHPDPPGLLADYPGLRESPSVDPRVRTSLNVRDSDATLVLRRAGVRSRGCDLTEQVARDLGRPLLVIGAGVPEAARAVTSWWRVGRDPVRLNVAGPRASEDPDGYRDAAALLRLLLRLP